MAASNGQGHHARGARQQAGRATGGGVGGANGAAVDTVRVTIPSEFAAGFTVQQQILDSAAKHGFGDQCLFALKIAVEEALVNAIKHGNKLDKNKHVTIEAEISPKHAEITIADEGPGFERGDVPDPLAEENLEKPSGRGILLIESYMTKVSWDQGGRRVRMVKSADDAGPGCSVA